MNIFKKLGKVFKKKQKQEYDENGELKYEPRNFKGFGVEKEIPFDCWRLILSFIPNSHEANSIGLRTYLNIKKLSPQHFFYFHSKEGRNSARSIRFYLNTYKSDILNDKKTRVDVLNLFIENHDGVAEKEDLFTIYFSRLKELFMENCTEFYGNVTKSLANLEVLNLSRCGNFKDDVFKDSKFQNTLKSLRLFNCSAANGEGIPYLPNLKELRIIKNGNIDERVLSNLKNLEILELDSCRAFQTGKEFQELKKLKVLIIDTCISLTDKVFKFVPSVEVLTIRSNPAMNGSGFRFLVNLKKLKISKMKIDDKRFKYFSRPYYVNVGNPMDPEKSKKKLVQPIETLEELEMHENDGPIGVYFPMMKNLKVLKLDYCLKIKIKYINEIREKLEECEVFPDEDDLEDSDEDYSSRTCRPAW